MQTFNQTIGKDEEQKPLLLQVVEKYWKDFPKCERQQLRDMLIEYYCSEPPE